MACCLALWLCSCRAALWAHARTTGHGPALVSAASFVLWARRTERSGEEGCFNQQWKFTLMFGAAEVGSTLVKLQVGQPLYHSLPPSALLPNAVVDGAHHGSAGGISYETGQDKAFAVLNALGTIGEASSSRTRGMYGPELQSACMHCAGGSGTVLPAKGCCRGAPDALTKSCALQAPLMDFHRCSWRSRTLSGDCWCIVWINGCTGPLCISYPHITAAAAAGSLQRPKCLCAKQPALRSPWDSLAT